jgi:hypothetical protein
MVLSFGGLMFGISMGGLPPFTSLLPADPCLSSCSYQSCSWQASPLTTPLSVFVHVMGSMSLWTPAGQVSCTPGAEKWLSCWVATKYARKSVVPLAGIENGAVWEGARLGMGLDSRTVLHPAVHP